MNEDDVTAYEASARRAALAVLRFYGPSAAFHGATSYRFDDAHHVSLVERGGFVVRRREGFQGFLACPVEYSPKTP